MSNIYFMCENCGIETNGITFVNGMKFCAKCYHQIFGKDNQQTEITQLKQQLAEKQKTIDEINKEFVQSVKDWKTLCAEKDKEIEKLKQQYTILENENGKLTTELIMDKYKKAKKEVSFGKQLALQKLEKVKEYCDKQFFSWENTNFNETYDNKDVSHAYYDVGFVIQQQINALEGEKDEKL